MQIHELNAASGMSDTDVLAIDTGTATFKIDYSALADAILSKSLSSVNSSSNKPVRSSRLYTLFTNTQASLGTLVANPTTQAYTVGQYASDGAEVLYRVAAPISSGASPTTTQLKKTSVGNELEGISKSFATLEGTKAVSNHSIGEYIWSNNVFYKVTSAITAGNTITEGTNVKKVQVADFMPVFDTKQGTIASIAAGAYASVDIDLSKTNYKPEGVVCLYKEGSASGYCALSNYSITSNTLTVGVVNASSSAVSNMTVKAKIMYFHS